MKLFDTFQVILVATTAISVLAQEGPLPVSDDVKAPTKKLREYLTKSTCYARGDGSEPDMIEQCKGICFPNPDPKTLSASSCWLSGSLWLDGSSAKPLEDQFNNIPFLTLVGTAIKGGYCSCNDPVILFAGDFFIKAVTEAGKVIEKVVCPALQALDIIIEFGSLAIPPPGKAIQGGMIAAIKTAKAYKYAHEAQDAAQEWANMIFGGLSTSEAAGCGKPPFSLAKLAAKFFEIANVPDATLPGGIDYRTLPCPKGGCRGTKEGDNPQERPQDRPKSDAPSKTDSTSEISATASKSTSEFTPKATQTADCKAIVKKLERESTAEKAQIARTLHDRRLVGKRSKKSGKACKLNKRNRNSGWNLHSNSYPSNPIKEANPENPDMGFDSQAYGWSESNTCDSFDWGRAHFTTDDEDAYQTEHILEWSVITNFFTQLNDQYKKDQFEHPKPAANKRKVNFCEYWEESWKFHRDVDGRPTQVMNNPAPQSGAKMFDPKKSIYKENDMVKLIKWSMNEPQVNSPREAIYRIRSVIGVFKYMQEPEIAKIFKDEKIRIGIVIDGIDKNLPKTPRVEDGITYVPWTTLGLGVKWDNYMDEVFKNAKGKGTKFIEDNIQRLKDEYTTQKAKDAAKDDTKKKDNDRKNIAEFRKAREDIEKILVDLEKTWSESKNWNKPW
ncbi:hypothetical protein HBH70_213330 [Parastagonospora nodorum]|nr:hypothetical protein HBH78_208130 [Parastagonospora nodorum]KAH4798187.1 hypothetical protein HBH63_075200 [Parastagonospora nodorum]KAH4894216.1 hypothetical protein HBI80_235150 [Parastagonospora nodorum]KAH4966013.1 hypothetical protein HBH73_061380 [Parastagonospora nodorum]KAH5128436.1 hypothetical protein HBH70_213330 [Parastagonospora nodorum]